MGLLKELVASQSPLTREQQIEKCLVSCSFRQLYQRHADVGVESITPEECIAIQYSSAFSCGLARMCVIQTAKEGGLNA